MTNYAVFKMGHDYVVTVDEKAVLKLSSRQKAARLLLDVVYRNGMTGKDRSTPAEPAPRVNIE